MNADTHPGLRATADVLYLVGEAAAAVMISVGERALAPADPPRPALHVVPDVEPAREHHRAEPARR